MSQVDKPAFCAYPAVLSLPVTVQHVRSFQPREGQPPALVLPDRLGLYYGDVDVEAHAGPHGVGILLCGASTPSGVAPVAPTPAKRISALIELVNTLQSGDRYGGQWRDGLFHGEGVLVTSTYTYQGGWEEGRMSGRACIQYGKGYVDRMPSAGSGVFDGGVGTMLLRGLSYLSPFDDSAHKPKEYMGDYHKVNLRHGHGMMRYFNGDVYEGAWASNRRHGYGKLLTSDGEVYDGLWERDERHGYGKIEFTDGSCFKGMLDRDVRQGEGVMVFHNGDEYYGNFEKDAIVGQGTMRYKNGDVYVGEWKDGMRHGTGEYTLKRTGVAVRGTFNKGLIEGTGTVEYPGVSLFAGHFERGERRHGTMFWHRPVPAAAAVEPPLSIQPPDTQKDETNRGGDGSSSATPLSPPLASAAVSGGSAAAKTLTTDKNSNIADDGSAKLCYQGDWSGENMHGKGKLWFRNGDFFAGTIVKNKRHGPGNQRYEASGREYSGFFVADKRHGYGVEQSLDGSIRAGRWFNDIFIEGYEGEWDGKELNGVGRLRLPVSRFLLAQNLSPETAASPAPSEMMEFFGVFKDGLRDGPGILKLPVVPNLFDKDDTVARGVLAMCTTSADATNKKKRGWKRGNNKSKSDADGVHAIRRRHIIKGKWLDDALHCDKGVWAFPTSHVYIGRFEEGERSGAQGRLWLPDGSVFVGDWRLNAPCGNGTFYCKNIRDPVYVRLAQSTTRRSISQDAMALAAAAESNSSGGFDFILRLFRSEREENDEGDEEEDSSSTRRKALVAYHDHYALSGTWAPCLVPGTSFARSIVPEVQQTLNMARPASMADTTMAAVAIDVLTATLEEGPATPLDEAVGSSPKGQSNTTAATSSFSSSSGTTSILKAPTACGVGRQSGEGTVRYPSGVCVQSFWLENYPQLAVPYRPGSSLDRFLGALQAMGCLPPGFKTPSQSSLHTDTLLAMTLSSEEEDAHLSAYVEAPFSSRGRTATMNQQKRKDKGSPFGIDQPMVSSPLASAAAVAAMGASPKYLKQRAGNAPPASTSTSSSSSSSVAGCTMCGRSFTFYRNATACTLCLRSTCTSCLGSLDVSMRPDVAALINSSHTLLTALEKGADAVSKLVGKTDDDASNIGILSVPQQSVQTVPTCADCARMVLLHVRRNIMWIPTRMFESVMQGIEGGTSRQAKMHSQPEVNTQEEDAPREEEDVSGKAADVNDEKSRSESCTTSSSSEHDEESADEAGEVAAATSRSQNSCADDADLSTPVKQSVPDSDSISPQPVAPSTDATVQQADASDGLMIGNEALKYDDDSGINTRVRHNDGYVVYAGYVTRNIPHFWGELWQGKAPQHHYYQGSFREGQITGFGTHVMPNGEKYVGMFHKGLWHGDGSYYAEDGSVYQGRFIKGKLRNLRYHGEVDDKMRRHGRGISYEADAESGGHTVSYNGMWHHGQRHGSGLLQLRQGTVYSGAFVHDGMEGVGKLVTSTSAYYGEFKSEKHGRGVEVFSECAVEGEWENGVSHGLCKIFNSNTDEVYETTYYNGNERDDCFPVPLMVDDDVMPQCGQCTSNFSLFLRRHHCRLCGSVFCDSCSQHRAVLPAHFKLEGAQRVCGLCFHRLEQRRMLALKRYPDGTVYAGHWSKGKRVGRGLYCRPDGIFIVMNKEGKPIIISTEKGNNNATTSTTPALGKDGISLSASILRDASPSRMELNAMMESSPKSELDAFTMWWAALVSRCQLRVTLIIPLLQRYHQLPGNYLRGKNATVAANSDVAALLSSTMEAHQSLCRYPRPPAMDTPSMFVSLDEVREDMKDGGGGSAQLYGAGHNNVEAAALRAARYAPSIAPRVPPCPQTAVTSTSTSTSNEPFFGSGDASAADCTTPPPLAAHDMSDEAVLQHIAEDRMERFLAFPPPSAPPSPARHDDPFDAPSREAAAPEATTTMRLLACYKRRPLFPPSPAMPPAATNAIVHWDDYAPRPLPVYRRGCYSVQRSAATKAALPCEAAMYMSCPFWQPHVPPVQEVLERGKMRAAAELMSAADGSDPINQSVTSADSLLSALDEVPAAMLPDGLPQLELPWALPVGVSRDKNGKGEKKKRDGTKVKTGGEAIGADAEPAWLPTVLPSPVRFYLSATGGAMHVVTNPYNAR